MLAECVACCVSLLAVYYMYRRKPPNQSVELTTVVPSWSPIQILWLDALPTMDLMSEVSSLSTLSDEHDNAVSDQTSWSVLPDKHLSSRLGEELDNISCPPNSYPDLVCQEGLDLTLPTSGGEEIDTKDTTKGL